jgi:peptidoglycan/xylan/chitin deacetylase (PgdA/CDA1 family)
MDLIFSFDTEDYLTPEAADAQKWWADELTRRGIRGSFQCVGELIRALRRRGREDVIASIAGHEIGQHTDYHSRPPTHPEALEGTTLAEGVEWVLRTEAPAFETLESTFGRVPISYCSPGDSWTSATLLAMAARGVKVFCNDKLHGDTAAPYWFCGLLTAGYSLAFEGFFRSEGRPSEAFVDAVRAAQARIPGDGVLILYSHPTRLVTSRFWDEPFFRARRAPLAECPAAPRHSDADIQDNKDRCRRWLDWLGGRSDLRIIDFATLYRERPGGRRALQDLLDECGLAPGQEGGLPLRPDAEGAHLSAASLAGLSYTWPVYPEGFTGKKLLAQTRALAWTSAPAPKE